MKLKNKKTGEIVETSDCDLGIMAFNSEIRLCGHNYNSLAELCEEWEDYEELKRHWFINTYGNVEYSTNEKDSPMVVHRDVIGNYFETKKEAELALEKLKALKRLKDAGFDGSDYGYDYDTNLKIDGEIYFSAKSYDGIENDFKLLLGDEE